MRLLVYSVWLLVFASFLARIGCEEVFGIVGENFTFPVKINEKIEEILWTKNKDKVAEWEGQNEPTYFTTLKNRGLLNKETGCLTIYNLDKKDTGIYVLEYLGSAQKRYNFSLVVLAPPSEPEISCNISGDDLALKCAADFEKPLNYTWKFSSISITPQTQETFIAKKKVDTSEKATCFIKFSQTEKSSKISLAQCFPNKKGDVYHKRSRVGLIVAFVLIPVVGILGFLYKIGRPKPGERAAQENSPLRGSDKELNKEDSALKDEHTVNSSVNQKDLKP